MRTRARFPSLEPGDAHYESFYVKVCHPSEPVGVWIRYTVHKRPGRTAAGSLWLTVFGPGGPAALKQTFADVHAPPEGYIAMGNAVLGPGSARGEAAAGGRAASWELAYEGSEEPFRHLPREWMYRAPLPRTKLLSPHPDVRFTGRIQLGTTELELDGWRGMVGHNWGAQHAERWIWMHGAGFEENDDAWLDAALGRIKLGPFTTPWIANAVLSVGGQRIRLGGPGRVRTTEVREAPERCDFVLTGDGVTVQGAAGADRGRFVGWVYSDPDGSEHHTVNCSIADMDLVVSRPGRSALSLALRGGAAYELGMREHDHGMEIQPFGDG